MKTLAIIVGLVWGLRGVAHAVEADENPQKVVYEACRTKVSEGSYGSRYWQARCVDSEGFDMPSPYLIKCAKWIQSGKFPTSADVISCRLFCESNTNWGPWRDYELDYSLKHVVYALQTLHNQGRCLE